MDLEEIAKKIDANNERINENARLINENVKSIENNFNKIEKNSWALEVLKDYKSESKKLFIILIIVLVMWFATIGYLVYVLNDTGTIEDVDTIDIQDVESIDNSHIKIGDDIWEKSN